MNLYDYCLDIYENYFEAFVYNAEIPEMIFVDWILSKHESAEEISKYAVAKISPRFVPPEIIREISDYVVGHERYGVNHFLDLVVKNNYDEEEVKEVKEMLAKRLLGLNF